ncbi:MAG: hypothetical protein LBI31_03040, partial [Zoogloeaceae bacterium]|nr:hypothetical protein [Zoogloeaceae bacterium]
MSVLSRKKQSGAVLLLMLLLLTLGALAWSLSAEPPRRDLGTAETLATAKEVLLGYAAFYPDARDNRKGFVPGHLPCPDMDESLGYEGVESGNCGIKGISALGHFPWRSLGVPPPRDSEAECLWYLVSGNHKAEPKADLLYPDTAGLIEIVSVDGKTAIAKEVVAVLFAPGKPLPGQARQHRTSADGKESECRRDYDASRYLEHAAP